MLRTNSKKAKENIRQTLIENIEDFFLYDWDLDNLTQKDILESYISKFIHEMSGHCDFAPHRSCNTFAVWFHHYRGCDTSNNWEIKKTVMAWLEQTEKEAEKFDALEMNEFYGKMLFRELNNLLKKNNLPQIFEVVQSMGHNFRKVSHREDIKNIHNELNIRDYRKILEV